MTGTLAEAVEALAVQTVAGEQSGEPLLRSLEQAVRSSGERGTGGGGQKHTRVPFDPEALQLFEDIAGQIATAFHAATLARPTADPTWNLMAWGYALQAAVDRGDLEEIALVVQSERVQRWRDRIVSFFDRPKVIDLQAVCPVCGERRVLVGEGEQLEDRPALFVTVRAGAELVAECRNRPACDGYWEGDRGMVELGRAVGMAIDADAVRVARVTAPEPSDSAEAHS